MTYEQKNAVIGAVEQAFKDAGIDMYVQAPRLLTFIDRTRPVVEAACSREALAAYFGSPDALEEEELAMMLAFLVAAPALLQQAVMGSVREVAASMPARVGPPVKLTPEMRREIVERVARLHASGVRIGVAQQRVAQQLAIGKRTVQTAWQDRSKLSERPFQSLQDIWSYLQRSGGH